MGDLKTTRWSSQVTPKNVWREYPRPAFARQGWFSLNGQWEYAFTKKAQIPSQFDGQILVPFSPEAPLSGVGRQLKPEEFLWYRTYFSLPEAAFCDGGRLLLHFGAVDQTCTVYINGKKAGGHTGGYLPFTLDITELCQETDQELLVQVRDLSDTGWHSRGKQKLKSGGMFYTAQSGIWQTVWLETVPEHYLKSVRIRPDYDKSLVRIRLQGTDSRVRLTVFEDFTDETLRHFLETGEVWEQERYSLWADCGKEWELPMEEFTAWTPETPKLYGLLLEGGEDRVLTYFAMRKCSVEMDDAGIPRLFLNGRPYFQNGLLDQGYWPDGLYTAPCDEALIFDIETAKSMGFHMLRKHVKVEMARWYYHCDRLGMMVWQDMVNGGSAYHSWFVTYLATAASCLHIPVKDTHRKFLSRREKEGRLAFYREMKAMVKALYNHPSIVVWVPFNEGWGQFETELVTKELRRMDPSRLIDEASGWFDQGGGDFLSIHSYFFSYSLNKNSVPRAMKEGSRKRAAALTEYGGFCLPVEGHRYSPKIYGYRQYQEAGELSDALEALWEKKVRSRIREGLSAAVYTQLSDVEEEINGLLTYDREVLKIPAEKMKVMNKRLAHIPEETIAVIGGAHGPTSVFLAGKYDSISKEERQRRQKMKMKRQTAGIVPSGHTTKELKTYLIETYGAKPLPETSEEYRALYQTMKGNLVLKEREELLKTPEPSLPGDLGCQPGRRFGRLSQKRKLKKTDQNALRAYMEAFEQRFKEAKELPDEVIPMSYSIYRFPVLEDEEKMGEMTVELEDFRQKIGISYANFKGQEEPREISKDIIRYFGVRQEDIEEQSERLITYLYVLGRI